MFHRNTARAAFAALFLLTFVPAARAADAPTIAIVDIQKIQSESKAAQSLQKQITAKREGFQKEFAAKEKELEASQKSLIEQKEKLSAEEFNKKRVEFEKKVSDTRSLFEKRRNSLVQGSNKANRDLERGIMEAAAKIGEQKKFDIVLRRDSVLIVDKGLDITDDVLKELNASMTDVKLQVE